MRGLTFFLPLIAVIAFLWWVWNRQGKKGFLAKLRRDALIRQELRSLGCTDSWSPPEHLLALVLHQVPTLERFKRDEYLGAMALQVEIQALSNGERIP